MQSKVQVLPIIASVGIGAAAYSLMTGKGGQLQQMLPQLSGMGESQSMKSSSSNKTQ